MADTIDAIMDAAERRIREAGYSGFSFREIAADVGVKSASVHYHFPTKEALAVAVARRYTDRFAEAIDEQARTGAAPIAVWRQVFRQALLGDGRMCLCGALGSAAADLPDGVVAEARRFFTLGIDRLIEAGLSRDKAMQVLATLEGAMLMASALGDATAFDRATASLG